MKKGLLNLFLAVILLAPNLAKSQSFNVTADTVRTPIAGTGSDVIYDFIINETHNPLVLKWTVIATNFPASWLTAGAFGICDNTTCYTNAAQKLWNPTFGNGSTFTTNTFSPYSDTTTHGDFHLALNLAGAVTGTYYVTVKLTDTVTMDTKNETFIVSKVPAATPSIKTTNEVVIYPNPAINELNVVYDAGSDVKTIAVYNMIGKVMNVYRVTDNAGANLNIQSLPAGIYFVRLQSSTGDVVAIKRFTKQ